MVPNKSTLQSYYRPKWEKLSSNHEFIKTLHRHSLISSHVCTCATLKSDVFPHQILRLGFDITGGEIVLSVVIISQSSSYSSINTSITQIDFVTWDPYLTDELRKLFHSSLVLSNPKFWVIADTQKYLRVLTSFLACAFKPPYCENRLSNSHQGGGACAPWVTRPGKQSKQSFPHRAPRKLNEWLVIKLLANRTWRRSFKLYGPWRSFV